MVVYKDIRRGNKRRGREGLGGREREGVGESRGEEREV